MLIESLRGHMRCGVHYAGQLLGPRAVLGDDGQVRVLRGVERDGLLSAGVAWMLE